MVFDSPTLVAALVTGIFVLGGAIITGLYSVKASRQARDAVREHVTAEGPTLEAFAAKLDRIDSKLDNALEWQGRHEAVHHRLGEPA